MLCDTGSLALDAPALAGALWRLEEPGRQLDANVVHLPPGARVDRHTEPDLDVLLLVLAGSGTLGGAGGGARPLTAGRLAWLPRGSARSLTADRDGLSYLTVHRRRPGLAVRPRPADYCISPGDDPRTPSRKTRSAGGSEATSRGEPQ